LGEEVVSGIGVRAKIIKPLDFLVVAEQGVNPFKFGSPGSSDTHTALATTREENYFGKAPHICDPLPAGSGWCQPGPRPDNKRLDAFFKLYPNKYF